jgi:hypothetical protein
MAGRPLPLVAQGRTAWTCGREFIAGSCGLRLEGSTTAKKRQAWMGDGGMAKRVRSCKSGSSVKLTPLECRGKRDGPFFVGVEPIPPVIEF